VEHRHLQLQPNGITNSSHSRTNSKSKFNSNVTPNSFADDNLAAFCGANAASFCTTFTNSNNQLASNCPTNAATISGAFIDAHGVCTPICCTHTLTIGRPHPEPELHPNSKPIPVANLLLPFGHIL
jgi:hypothetical protein